MKVFCDLIETQSFSKTAILNSVTQSAISQQLKSIERRQDAQLVERVKRRMTLTAEGEVFYRYARDIVPPLRRNGTPHPRYGWDDFGNRALGIYLQRGDARTGALSQNLPQSYPRVNFRLQYDQAKKIYDDVSNVTVDLGIVPYPHIQRNVEVIPFTRNQMVVTMHPNHELASRKTLSPKELNKYPLVLFTGETPTRHAIDRFFKKHKVRPNIVMELDHIATIKHAVEVDIGLSIVPINAIEHELACNTLACLHFVDRDFDRPLGILFRKGRSLSMATQKLLNILLNGVQKIRHLIDCFYGTSNRTPPVSARHGAAALSARPPAYF